MEYRNTTDIPNRLIEIAVAFSIQENVKLFEIIIKNKRVDKLTGQYGLYYPDAKRVILNVPQSIPAHGIRYTMKNCGLRMVIMTRAEFVVCIMAHELRHGWQWQHGSPEYRMSGALRERDAEQYQYGILAKWRQFVAAQTSVGRVA